MSELSINPKRLKALFVIQDESFDLVFGPSEQAEIAKWLDLVGPQQTTERLAADASLLKTVDVLITGWGGPVLDDELLAAAPALKAVFHGGGAMGGLLTEAAWERDLVVSTAILANAIPVAEFTMAAVIMSLKHAWALSGLAKSQKRFVERNNAPGCFGSTVGLVSLGATGQRVAEMLKALDVKVLAYDPYLTEARARALHVERVSLDAIFARSDVVSLHTPLIEETRHMIGAEHFARMKSGAAFINTSRGQIVQAAALLDAVTSRADVQFVLDVTDPEPPEADSILYRASNVFLTPHIAGSVGNECRRMGRYVVEEIGRYVRGEPLRFQVTPETACNSSHRPSAARKRVTERNAPVSVTCM